MNYDVLLVDGSYLSHRSFDAPYKLMSSSGLDATLIHSFLRSLNAIRKKFNPNEIMIAWESPGTPSWRRALLPSYKPTKTRNEPYIHQVQDLQILLSLMGYEQWYSPKNEADDVIAKLSLGADKTKLIFTVDKDIMQLVNPLVHVYTGKDIMIEASVKDKFGVYPHQIPDLLAITGDKADNIEGIKGYGPKKASAILRKYGYIEKLPNDEPLNAYRIKLLLNKRLTYLNKQCTLQHYQPTYETDVETILDKYELKKIKENINTYLVHQKEQLSRFF